MPNENKKGITVKIDADLHTEVRRFLEEHGMTMAEFVTAALENELHPKNQLREENYMGNMRTLAFQVPEELFQKIKEYLQRNNMTQKDFMIGLIEAELERDLTARESQNEARQELESNDEEESEQEDNGIVDDLESAPGEAEEPDESESEGMTVLIGM